MQGAYFYPSMKSNIPRRLSLAALGCLASLALPLSAETTQETPVTRDNNKPVGAVPPPAPTVDASGTATPTNTQPGPTYNSDQPIDRDNKPLPPHDTRTIQPLDSTANHTPSDLTHSDRRIIKKTATTNEYEIALSRQAVGQASNSQVRAYAEMMVRDHERMNRELATLSSRRGVVIQDGRRYEHDLNGLSKKTGASYDSAYIDEMVDSHEDAIDVLEKASRSKDPDVAALAVQYLPTLREHLARAQELAKMFD